MSEATPGGPILWHDLTVPDAAAVRDFYQRVMGWTHAPVEMGGYADFNMLPAAGAAPLAGICHQRGANAKIPPAWLVYFQVNDLDASLAACAAGGGSVIDGPRGKPGQRFAVIRDPAGAVCALCGA